MMCQVCGESGAEPHFGGESCRACAAFFRRYVHSKKTSILCTCGNRMKTSHACRHCRMLKCLATGMAKCKVQAIREKTKQLQRPPTFTSISLLACDIIPLDCHKISCTVANWVDLDRKRKDLQGISIFDLNFTQFSTMVKGESLLLWDLGHVVFPELSKLNEADKSAILLNFYPRWMMLASAIDYSANYEHFQRFLGTEDYYSAVGKFYGTSIPKKQQRLKMSEVVRMFVPYWDWHYVEIADPIYRKKCDKVEYAAIFLLLLFDVAYSNISEDCSRILRDMRKLILRELKAYQTNNNCSEMRFIETLQILELLEKAEAKLQEEFIVCELQNVTIHEDYKAIMQTRKL